MTDITFYEIEAKFGSSEDTSNVYVCETDNNTWWYCVAGSCNVNESIVEPFDGCDLTTDVHDIDCFTLDIESLTHFEDVMRDHLTPETVTRAILTIEIDSINSAFQDDSAQTELVRILKGLIEKVERNNFDNCKIKDVNGNNVGDFYLDIEEEEV